jgi:hypothetical protein
LRAHGKPSYTHDCKLIAVCSLLERNLTLHPLVREASGQGGLPVVRINDFLWTPFKP